MFSFKVAICVYKESTSANNSLTRYKKKCPASVNTKNLLSLRNSATPNSVSKLLIAIEIVGWETCMASLAFEILPWLQTA